MLSQVLIVHGENDALVPAANSRRLAAMLPGARLEVLPACGHNPQVIISAQRMLWCRSKQGRCQHDTAVRRNPMHMKCLNPRP